MSAHSEHANGDAHGHDDWFRHTADEGSAQSAHTEVVNIKAIVISFVAITVSVLALVGILIVYFDYTATQIRVERTETTVLSEQAQGYKARAKAELTGYAWVDPQDPELVRLPVESAGGRDAMSKVVQLYSGDE